MFTKDQIKEAVQNATADIPERVSRRLETWLLANQAKALGNAKPEAGVNDRVAKSKSRGLKKLILVNPHSPGDIIMMTSAIRDLHQTYPGEYQTDVETPCPEIFEGNPYITKLNKDDSDVVRLDTHYPLIHTSNQGAHHFIHGYRKHLEELIGRPITQGDFCLDLHIRDEEKAWLSAVEEVTHDNRPFWLVDAGYKNDFTAKAWPYLWYQQVVDKFKDRIQFVQIGHEAHNHFRLTNVIDMVGQTDLRQLIRLVYHSIGILTPVSMPMVLAAAVPVNKDRYPMLHRRPCVVVAGAREPVQWQHLPDHQYLHNCGAMSCAPYGGCWRSRVVPIGDQDEKDKNNLCLQPAKTDDGQNIAQCMLNITVDDVCRAISRYYEGGLLKYDTKPTISIRYQNRDRGKMNTYTDSPAPGKQETKAESSDTEGG